MLVSLDDPKKLTSALLDASRWLSTGSCSLSPAELSTRAIEAVRPYLPFDDPFQEVKAAHTSLALGLFPALYDKLYDSPDPFATGLKFAACGNVIDLGSQERFDLNALLAQT